MDNPRNSKAENLPEYYFALFFPFSKPPLLSGPPNIINNLPSSPSTALTRPVSKRYLVLFSQRQFCERWQRTRSTNPYFWVRKSSDGLPALKDFNSPTSVAPSTVIAGKETGPKENRRCLLGRPAHDRGTRCGLAFILFCAGGGLRSVTSSIDECRRLQTPTAPKFLAYVMSQYKPGNTQPWV